MILSLERIVFNQVVVTNLTEIINRLEEFKTDNIPDDCKELITEAIISCTETKRLITVRTREDWEKWKKLEP